MHRCVDMAFGAWREHASKQQRAEGICARVLKHWSYRWLSVAFVGWCSGASWQIRSRGICRRVVLKLSRARIAWAFSEWCCAGRCQPFPGSAQGASDERHVEKRIHYAWTLCCALMRVQSGVMLRAWNRWFDRVISHKDLSIKMRRGVKRLMDRSLSAAWGRWWDKKQRARQSRVKESKVVMIMLQNELTRSFERWKYQRVRRGKVTACIYRMTHRNMAKVMTFWRQGATAQKRLKHRISRVLSKLASTRASKAFEHWEAQAKSSGACRRYARGSCSS